MLDMVDLLTSEDATTAAAARLYATALPETIANWVSAETARRTDASRVLTATMLAFSFQLAAVMALAAKPDVDGDAYTKDVGKVFADMLKSAFVAQQMLLAGLDADDEDDGA